MADIGRNRSAVTCDQVQRKLVARYSTHETPADLARVALLLKGKCTKCHVNGIGFGSSLRPSSSPLNFFTFAIDLAHHAQYDSHRCNVAESLCNPQCPRGGIGRRAWFRSMCRKVWGFESLRGHHKIPQKAPIELKSRWGLFSLQRRFDGLRQRDGRTADQPAQRAAAVIQRA